MAFTSVLVQKQRQERRESATLNSPISGDQGDWTRTWVWFSELIIRLPRPGLLYFHTLPIAHFSDDEFEDPVSEPQIGKERCSLLGSLNGIPDRAQATPIDVFITIIDYTTSPEGASRQFEEPLDTSRDRKALCRLFDYGGAHNKEIMMMLNDNATREAIINAGRRLADTSVTLMQGHAYLYYHTMELPANNLNIYDPNTCDSSIEYLTYDYYTNNPPRGLTCNDLSDIFIPPCNSGPTRRLLLSDFCFGYNFNVLQYVLEAVPGMPPRWVTSPNWDPKMARDEDDVLVHFAGGSPGQQTHEAGANGGFFTQGFCRAMDQPRTLPDLLATVRDDVVGAMRNSGESEMLQIPQIYSSCKLDLNDSNVMKMFGFFDRPTPSS